MAAIRESATSSWAHKIGRASGPPALCVRTALAATAATAAGSASGPATSTLPPPRRQRTEAPVTTAARTAWASVRSPALTSSVPIPGEPSSAVPTSRPVPCTRLITPGGTPAPAASCAKATADSGARSDGLITAVRPAARRGRTEQITSASGSPQDRMCPASPRSWLRTGWLRARARQIRARRASRRPNRPGRARSHRPATGRARRRARPGRRRGEPAPPRAGPRHPPTAAGRARGLDGPADIEPAGQRHGREDGAIERAADLVVERRGGELPAAADEIAREVLVPGKAGHEKLAQGSRSSSAHSASSDTLSPAGSTSSRQPVSTPVEDLAARLARLRAPAARCRPRPCGARAPPSR